MNHKFVSRLCKANYSFNLEEALLLSDELHEFEANGGELTRKEDLLWIALTDKIEEARSK